MNEETKIVFVRDEDIERLLHEARVLDANSPRIARRNQLRKAREILGRRAWAREEARIAVGGRRPFSGVQGDRIGLARLDGLRGIGSTGQPGSRGVV